MWTVASSQLLLLSGAACWRLGRRDLSAIVSVVGLASTACHLCGALGLAERFRFVVAADVLIARSAFVYVLISYASPRVCACSFYGAFVYLTALRSRSWAGYAAPRPPRHVVLHCSIHAVFSLGIYLAAIETVKA